MKLFIKILFKEKNNIKNIKKIILFIQLMKLNLE